MSVAVNTAEKKLMFLQPAKYCQWSNIVHGSTLYLALLRRNVMSLQFDVLQQKFIALFVALNASVTSVIFIFIILYYY